MDTILRFLRAKEEGLINHVYVMGCLSERYKCELEKEIPDVDRYFGSNDLVSIIEHLGLHYRHNLVGERLLTTPSHYAYLENIGRVRQELCILCHSPDAWQACVPAVGIVKGGSLLPCQNRCQGTDPHSPGPDVVRIGSV